MRHKLLDHNITKKIGLINTEIKEIIEKIVDSKNALIDIIEEKIEVFQKPEIDR